MQHHFSIVIILLISLFCFTQTTHAASLQNLIDNAPSGSTLTIPTGVYPEQLTVSQPLSLKCDGVCQTRGFIVNADNVTISDFDITSLRTVNNSYGIRVSGSNCALTHNYIHDTVRDGILLDQTSNSCTVTNNRFVRTSQTGIEVHGNNHQIINNEISHTIQYPPELKADSYWGNLNQRVADADCFRFFGNGHLFKNNYCHDITYGIQLNEQGDYVGENIDPHIDGFQTWNDARRLAGKNIVFTHNIIILSGTGGGFTNKSVQLAGGASNLEFVDNIFHTTLGVSLAEPASDIAFDHNTWVGDKTNPGSWGINAQDCNNCNITNSVFAHFINGAGYLRTNSTATVHHNCLWNNGGSRKPDYGDILADPEFADTPPTSTNLFLIYSLKDSSPCKSMASDGTDMGIRPPVATTPPINPSLPGDLNADNRVDLYDFNLLIKHFNNPYTLSDYNFIVSNFGKVN